MFISEIGNGSQDIVSLELPVASYLAVSQIFFISRTA